MKNGKNKMQAMNNSNSKAKPAVVSLAGPSCFELEYLRELKEELEIFLRSKNFSTIEKFDIAFAGGDYMGRMQIGA